MDSSQRSLSSSAILQLVGINLLWAGSSVSSKAGLTAVGPFTLALVRFLPAGLLLLALARIEGPLPSARRSDRLSFFCLGLIGIVVTYGIFYTGMRQATATDASLLFGCEPLLIALFARIFLQERLTGQQWLGLMVGLAGIWLIAGQALGNLIMLCALCCETATSILGKRLTQGYPGLFVVAVEMLLGSALLLPLAGWEVGNHPPTFSWQAFAGILYLTLICSVVCYGVWYWLLSRFPVSTMGIFILTQTLAGPVYGWLVFEERLQPSSAAGGALIIFGIVLTTMTRRFERPPA